MDYRWTVALAALTATSCLKTGSEDDTAGSEAVLRDGTWRLEVDDISANTCPLTEEDFGLGDYDLLDIVATDTSFTISSNGQIFGSYTVTGNAFSDERSEVIEIEDPCYLRRDDTLVGDIIGQEYFTMEDYYEFQTEGDCSAWDTTGYPCSVKVLITGEWVGE